MLGSSRQTCSLFRLDLRRVHDPQKKDYFASLVWKRNTTSWGFYLLCRTNPVVLLTQLLCTVNTHKYNSHKLLLLWFSTSFFPVQQAADLFWLIPDFLPAEWNKRLKHSGQRIVISSLFFSKPMGEDSSQSWIPEGLLLGWMSHTGAEIRGRRYKSFLSAGKSHQNIGMTARTTGRFRFLQSKPVVSLQLWAELKLNWN